MRVKQIIKAIILKNKKRKMSNNAVFPKDLTISRYTLIQNNGNLQNVSIGRHCTLFGIIQALYGGNIKIGDNVFVGSDSMIQSSNSIRIGNNVIISNNVTICDNNNHPVDPVSRMKMSQCSDYLHDELWTWKYAKSSPIIIEDNTWIGKNSSILKGVTVGKGSIVALGAIVTKDVPPYTIVAGNPAVVVRSLFYENYKSDDKE